ncbi:hypothetical protein CAEBREN_06036 [Caenorhabditis brenneri]|uniref:Uncharacterized protein n=1 Tax=Caenorhabditis brenneri TaxID=135651 RepID=G0NKE6_CAEBE|nr:hypothetical protein CAEBREN_06036 [Caenorhabditis brenneri]
MPPNFYIPHHPMQQVQHFVYPQNQGLDDGLGKSGQHENCGNPKVEDGVEE